ncbi:Lactate-responsive regulator LldR [Desulfurella amilsii]|uniref:Lactate-responsive regulator LldR n=1 Tax=Desulfurella amilsii TaxID=1562698 RepID=A0A1X4XXC8_9BACT|nr:FadR/GntR family transcriptional regulator [Desulfurella amilsii]OSS42183.1 Lactate-responsive regulator LldR [Desulfurella amilsii]
MIFKPIKQKKISEEIVEQIELYIKDAILKPNEKLPSERDLAKMFEVSRSSVREALNMLEAKGLIESIQGDGTFIKSVGEDILKGVDNLLVKDPKLTWELMEIRKTLEVWAVEMAAKNADEESKKYVTEAYMELEKVSTKSNSGEYEDAEFHLSIIKASKNTVLYHMMMSIFNLLKDTVKVGREYVIKVKGLSKRELLLEHKAIMDAIIQNNPSFAKQSMLKHLSFIDQDFKNYLDKFSLQN